MYLKSLYDPAMAPSVNNGRFPQPSAENLPIHFKSARGVGAPLTASQRPTSTSLLITLLSVTALEL
jgi:hypothetical protein